MGITIRHLTGPLAGEVQHFDDTVGSILFGRDREAQVVYPPECDMVGRRHFALKRSHAGTYTVELFGHRYVEIDSKPAEQGMPVKAGSLIRLGSRNGPSCKVEIRSSIFEANFEQEIEDELGEVFVSRLRPPAVPTGLSPELIAAHYSTAPEGPEIFASIDPMDFDMAESRDVRLKVRDNLPIPEQSLSRSTASFWWIITAVAAAAAGALTYLFYRGDIALGAVVGNLVQAAMPSTPARSEASTSDLVDVSVFGPKSIQTGGESLVQVFLHQLDQRELAMALAEQTDPDTTRRGVQTLAAEIERGQCVTIMIEGRGLTADEEMQSLVWRGEPCSCQFTMTSPEDSVGRTFHPRILVLINSVPVGSIAFALKVSADTDPQEMEIRGYRARRYAYAFLSYASPDRAEVLKRAQGMKASGTDFFNDLLSLEPGERWEQRLYREIDRCDVFYLFWSSKAKASEWVLKEAEYALARRASSEDEHPDIVPVIIEGPPPPEPPDTLKELHFDDCLLYVLAATESGSRSSASGQKLT